MAEIRTKYWTPEPHGYSMVPAIVRSQEGADSPNTETQGSPKVTSRRGRGTVCAVPERNQMAGGSKGQPPRSWWTRSRRETESNNTDTACYEACKLEKVRA